MAGAQGTKEIGELIAGMKLVLLTVKSVMKDGKVDMSDLGILVGSLAQAGVLVESVKGLDVALLEVKELDAGEAVAIVEMLYAAAKEIQAA